MHVVVTLERDGYVTKWKSGPKVTHEIYVDIFRDGAPILEWAFPMIVGNSVMGNATFYLEQAIMYAKNPPGKKTIKLVATE